MIRGTYASTAGMVAMLARVETVANNLANVDTTGYKEDTLPLTTFPSQRLVRLHDAPTGASGPGREVGAAAFGVFSAPAVARLTQGGLRATDNPLDVALFGAGFFSVQTPEGVRYTRDGAFQRDAGNRLVTAAGHPVLDAGGQPIVVPAGDTVILEDGEVRVDGAAVGRLGLFDVADPTGLQKAGGNLFAVVGGGVAPAAGATVHQSHLEGANVDPTRAMAHLMAAQRAYEASARLVQIQDEMTGRAVSDVGRV